MPDTDLEHLKKRVESFLQSQVGYDAHENLTVVCDEGDMYFILYGCDVQIGVAGFGETADRAFENFVENWKMYRSARL